MPNIRTATLPLVLSGLLAAQAVLGAPAECSYDGLAGYCRDMNLIKSIRYDGDRYVSDRSIDWVEAYYLSPDEAGRLQTGIDEAIGKTEKYLKLGFDPGIYGSEKIEFYVHGRRIPSRTITGDAPRKYMHPVVILSHAKEKKASYVKQIVNLIAWDWHTLWLKEGLAVFLNDRFSEHASFPNFGESIDRLASDAIRGGAGHGALELLGRNGIPEFGRKRRMRRMFYVLSGSFARYLERNLGIGKFMEIYTARNASSKIPELTGKPVAEWKSEWKNQLQ